MRQTTAEKMGIRPSHRGYILNVSDDTVPEMGIPFGVLEQELSGKFDFLHLFANTLEDLQLHIPKLLTHLSVKGSLWVSWPKLNPVADRGLKMKHVVDLGREFGLIKVRQSVPVPIWSAIKFRYPDNTV
jgi:hypothetical protein